MPPIGFAIISDQYETFHQLLKFENLDKSIHAVRMHCMLHNIMCNTTYIYVHANIHSILNFTL